VKGVGDGGLAARRAMLRWGWRLFRREWRQQALVLALMTVAVASAAFTAAFGYNFPRTDEALFGSAHQRMTFSATEPQATADTAAAQRYFPAVDTFSTRIVPVPGEARRLFVRDTDPNGRFTAPIVAVRAGRYPTGDEVAVTDEVARDLGAAPGGSLTIDGRSRPVVGIVQNPADYDDEFALVAPGRLDRRDLVTLLTDGSRDIEAFRQQMTVPGNVDRQTRRTGERAKTALVTLGLAAVGLLLVALIAAAGFVVLAKRRQRQFGLLAAAGATERQVRMVTVINGALVGLVAAVGGTVLGMAAWELALPRVQAGAGHDIPGFSVPLWVIATSLVLAVGAAVTSAWWPARAVARIPVMEALSARPPRPRPVHRSVIATVVLVAAGLLCLHLGDGGRKPVLLVAGLPMVLVGVLLSAPVTIRLLGPLAGRLPLTGRLALRDLARYQARSGAALAAISLALAIPVGIVVVATAETAQAANHNLSDGQLLFRIGQGEGMAVPIRSDADIATLDGQIAGLVAGLDGARALPLDMAVDPSVPTDHEFEAGGAQSAAALFWKVPGEDRARGIPLYVASPELLGRFGAASSGVDAHAVWFRETTGDLRLFSSKFNNTPITDVGRIPDPVYSALPDAFLSPAAARSHGWITRRAGWFVEATRPLSDTERATARRLAVDAGLTVDMEDRDASLTTLRFGATAGGMLLALGVLAMTVALIRSEVAADLRTLTAIGAGVGIRRRLTAATAGALALLGVVLGLAAAYLALVGAYLGNLGALRHVPVVDLVVTAVGVPLLAYAAGWLLAGRQPPAIARAALE